MLIPEEGGDMVNVPLEKKKKKCRLARLGELSSPGRATSAPKYKSDERGDVFFIQKLLFPLFKSHTHGIYEFAVLGSSFFAFFDSVSRFCSSPTSKYSIPKLSSFSLVYFDLLLVL